MRLALEFVLEEKWPALAWIARCAPGEAVVRVWHGPQVEVRSDWYCEAVWDSDFEVGNLDQTDIVFGSGGRVRDGGVCFVSSGSTVDRLHLLKRAGEIMVSNSLPCLLAQGQVEVDPAFDGWFELFLSIKDGIDAYARRLPTTDSAAEVELVYFRNLVWNGKDLSEVDKPVIKRDLGAFDRYLGFLRSSVDRLAANMRAASRRHRYEMVGTLSSGYDSATTAALCRPAGMTTAVSAGQARGGGGADDGREVAKALGLELISFERGTWRGRALPEAPFFAANPRGGEVFLSAAEDHLRGKVLVTGFHGDKVWGKTTTALGPDLVRGDMSGLSLCEYRLHLGCIQMPLAFIGVRQIRDIHALSNSPEMAPWDIPGDYSRPVCRRIVEEAGVPRQAFGVSKKMASVHFGSGEALLTDRTRDEYHRWLRRKTGLFDKGNSKRPQLPNRLILALRRRHYVTSRVARAIGRPLPGGARKWIDRKLAALQWELNRRINVAEHVFPWAVERMSKCYMPAGRSPGRDRGRDRGREMSS